MGNRFGWIVLCGGLWACTADDSATVDPDETTDGDPVPTNGGDTDLPTGDTDDPVTTPEGVPMLVAQGHGGRTVVSCDDGNTWVAEQSNDDALRCWSDNWEPDCDHRYDSARGITYGDGWFVATFGWGAPGAVYRSRDGVNWEETLSGTTVADIAYGNGTFIGGDWAPWRSTDGGATWEQSQEWVLNSNARRVSFLDIAGGLFVLENDGPLAISADNGDSWYMPPTPPGCGNETMFSGGVAAGNGVILGVSGQGEVCRSTDDGATFTAGTRIDIPYGLSSRLLWTGSEFAVWSWGSRHTSTDGLNWTASATNASVELEAVTQTVDGTFIGVNGWYEDQDFYRSSDGVDWQAVSGFGSHPLYDMTAGMGEASAVCP